MDKGFELEIGRHRLYYSVWYQAWAIQTDGGWAVPLFESYKKARKRFDKLTT